MGQDTNAANAGDQLKHCLLAEVLRVCRDWPDVTYAETHGGAGVYDATKQVDGKKAHIRDLKRRVTSLDDVKESDAGGRYAQLLKKWWSEGEHADLYPGSVLQAAIQLKEHGRDAAALQIRVSESCKETHSRLARSLEPFGVEPHLSGFQNEMSWLTENDSLLLLIDPFTYTDNREALNKGHLDLRTLTALLEKCWTKSRCVVGFWCAMGQKQPDGAEKQRRFTGKIRGLADEHSASFRWFKYGQYSIAWIGIGSGTSAVDGIPSRDAWKRSFLKRIVREP